MKMYGIKRGGSIVPAGRWDGEQFDTLPSGIPMLVSVSTAHRSQRSIEQNSLLWSLLGQLSRQVIWHGQKLSAEDWKCVMTAGLKAQRVVPGVDGGTFVVIGQSTKEMTVAVMTDLIELIYAFGAQHAVIFRENREAV